MWTLSLYIKFRMLLFILKRISEHEMLAINSYCKSMNNYRKVSEESSDPGDQPFPFMLFLKFKFLLFTLKRISGAELRLIKESFDDALIQKLST